MVVKEKSASDRAEEIIISAWDELNSGKVDSAIAKAREALVLDSDDWYINSSLGLFLRKRGDLEEALQFSKQGVRLAPEVSIAWENVGLVYYDQGYFERAVYCFDKSVEFGERVSTYTLLASSKFSLEDLEGTIEACKKALELDPEWDEAETLLKKARKELDAG